MGRTSPKALSGAARHVAAALLTVLHLAAISPAADWPQWGRAAGRNAASPEKNPFLDFDLPLREDGKPENAGRNIAWRADLGTKTFVPPVVADGLVWVCTNAREPNDEGKRAVPEKDWDGGLLMCLRESDGKLLWKGRTPRLGAAAKNDLEDPRECPIGSAPLVEGDRLWYLNNRSEVVCLDIAPIKNGIGDPREVWKLDLRKQYGVFPQAHWCSGTMQGFGASVGAHKGFLYVSTRNSADESRLPAQSRLELLARALGWEGPDRLHVPAPDAPSLLCLEKATGKLVWKDASPGDGILEFQPSSPLVAEVNGKPQVIVGQGDGWLRGFDGGTGKLLWKCDLNPKGARWDSGEGERNYIVATPVLYDGRVYVGTGRDTIHWVGPAALFCIDPTKAGDVSAELAKGKPNPNSAVVWHTPQQVPDDAPRIEVGKTRKRDLLRSRDFFVGRMVASVTVHDGLLYAADVTGFLYCFDAKTGKLNWADDLKANVAGQPLWVDGKVVVTTDGGLFVYAHGTKRQQLRQIDADTRFDAGAVFANGTLFLAGMDTLFAVRKPK